MSNERYPIPAAEARTEIEVKRSRFIATAVPAFTVAEAKAFIARIKSEFSDATHNVPAFIIGYGTAVTAHCNDDGEPSGTAGRPILAVLQGSGLGDIALVVTRYYGGTNLGTGGLVRAYSGAAKAVLDILPRAERVSTHTVLLAIPYNYLERIRLLVEKGHGRILEEDFAADITITAQFPTDRFPAFQNDLRELSHGSLAAEIIETNDATILPTRSSTSLRS